MRARSPLRTVAAVAGALLVLVAIPAVLVALSTARFGHASPLHGMDAPWRWTLDATRSWWHRATDQLDTSSELIDLFLRVALVAAWVCVAIIVATVVGEVVFQLRHGMPSSGHRNVLGLGWLGRAVASGLIALIPLAAPAPALAGGPIARSGVSIAPGRAAPLSSVPAGRPGSAAREVVPPVAPGGAWVPYVVQRGDSVWSIAVGVIGRGSDVADAARKIVDANRGATMPDGRRFTTPALIEPGWVLLVPSTAGASGAPPSSVALSEPVAASAVPDGAPPADAAPPVNEHVVGAGDSYWRIAADELADDETPATPERVLAYTDALIEANAPRLGHTDPTLILPGEQVILVPEATIAGPDQAAADAVPDPAVDQSAAGADQSGAGQPTAADQSAAGADQAGDVAAVLTPSATADVPVAANDAPPVAAATPVIGGATSPAAVGGQDGDSTEASSGASRGPVVADATTDDPDGPEIPIGLTLGVSLAVATGAVALLEARRRQRLRAAEFGERLAQPSPDMARREVAMRALSQPERMARLDLALRSAAPDLAVHDARVLAVELTAGGEVRVTPDRSAAPTGDLWRLDLDGCTWVLAARISMEDLAPMAQQAMIPCPALAHVGATDRGQLFVDLEAIGFLAVDLPEPLATDVVRCVAASVALSPLAGAAQIVTVGLPAEGFLASSTSVDDAASLDAALELAAVALGTTRSLARGTSTFAMRARGVGGEAWEPAIVFATGATGDVVRVAQAAAGDGLAVVVAATEPTAGWRIEVVDDHAVLQPLGCTLTPCGLSVGSLAELRELVAVADVPLEVRSNVVRLPAAAVVLADQLDRDVDDVDDDDHVAGQLPPEPQWSLLVRVFGQVEVVTADGDQVAFDRSKALELVVWLTQHRRRPTRAGARTALWDTAVRDATFANVVSDARRAMARAVPPADGEEWLARTLTEELPIHPAVLSDAELLAVRVEQAKLCPPGDAVEILRGALELVTGMPFAGTAYLWPDAEGISSSVTLLAVGAAMHMARLCLDRGDIEGVFWATGQGLQVLAGHEELIALRMRAHAAAGDLAGVRHEWAAYERALDADPWAAAQPAPKLVSLRHELLSAPGSAVAGS